MCAVLGEVGDERHRQHAKWGRQDHPSFDAERMPEYYEMPTAHRARALCEKAFQNGKGTFAHIAVEEFVEAIDAHSEDELRAELVQVAAVCVAWVEAIDRRRGGA